jgi:hypothetical protein
LKTEGTFAGNVGDAAGPRFAGAGSKDKFVNVGDVGDAADADNVGDVGDVGDVGPLVAETGALMLLIVAVLV